jgi:hypothetical protein
MNLAEANSKMSSSNRTSRLKEAVIASFREPAPEVAERLGAFSVRDWEKALFWLDASGFALYLLDRLTALGLQHLLPEPLLARLQQNLHDNRARTTALFEEAVTVSYAFQRKQISFALLKGVTLVPVSVPDSSLRYQWDLDFLIAEKDAMVVQEILQDFGYTLHAVSGETWEFKAGVSGMPDISNIYKVRPYRSLELHLLPAAGNNGSSEGQDRLARAELRRIRGETLTTLSPEDLFVQQALHLFKHICSEYTRASWVLEYWRHVLARRDDAAFWRDVKSIAENEPQADVSIGAVTLLATQFFGEFAPEELKRWTVDRLSPAVRLWIETYGRRALLTEFPGSKLYLILQQQLHVDRGADQAARRLLFPIHMPPKITHGEIGKGLLSRLMSYRAQSDFIFVRLRFHVVEGLRYVVESSRWQRRLTGMTQ